MSDDDIYLRPAREWPIPPMDKAPGDKPSAFTWEMGHLILERIAEGDTMRAITADPRMPAYCTVFRWMQVVPPFGREVRKVRARLARARRAARDRARASKAPARRGGRRSTYSEAVAEALLERIEDGASVSEVVREPGMPSFKALYAWLRARPDFRDAFIEACRRRHVGFVVEIDTAIDDVVLTGKAAAGARIRALEGRAGRLTPKLYRPG